MRETWGWPLGFKVCNGLKAFPLCVTFGLCVWTACAADGTFIAACLRYKVDVGELLPRVLCGKASLCRTHALASARLVVSFSFPRDKSLY